MASRSLKLTRLLTRVAVTATLLLALSAASWADESQTTFNIPPQPLGPALREFARQSNHEILFSSEIVKDKATQGITGPATADLALAELLKGTGLTFSLTSAGQILISTADAKEASANGDPPGAPNGARSDQSQINRTSTTPGTAGTPLEEIVVTAQRREESLRKVPISASVVTGFQLDQSTAAGVTEVLNAVPGVATQQNYLGGGTVVVIRGVAPSFPAATGSSPVAYYLDSVPVGLVRSAVGPDQEAFDLSRVEVLRGPQGTLYGASALNGVVRVLSNDAVLNAFDLKARTSDSGTQSGGNNYRGDLAVNVPIIQDKLAVRAVAGYQSNSGWIDQPDKNNVNDSTLQNYRLKINAQPTDDLSLGLSAWRSRERADAPSTGYTFEKSSALLAEPLNTDFDAYAFKVNYQLPWFTVSSATSYFDYSNAGTLDLLPFAIPDTTFFSGITSHVFSEEVNLISSASGPWRWSAGAIYRKGTEGNLQSEPLPSPSTFIEWVDLESKSYAVYGEVTRLLLEDRLELTAGVRHFHDDISQVGQLVQGAAFTPANSTAEANTPRAVVTWHQTERLMFYASYSQGFRSGFPQDPTVPAGFPPVLPDRLRNYELGSKGAFWDGRVAYDASVYYMSWQGIQQSITVPFENLTTIAVVNGIGASGVGSDLAVTVEPVQDLTIQGSISWNSLQFDHDVISGGLVLFNKGDRTTSSPEFTAGLSTQYSFPLGKGGYGGTLAASVNHTSAQVYRGFVGSTVSQLEVDEGDPITLTRLSFAVHAPNRVRASLFVDNLNNERGAPVRAFVGIRNWDARIRPRTIGLQLEYGLH